MDDIRGMGGVSRVSDLDPEPQHRLESEWTGGESVLQRRPSRYSMAMNGRPSCSPMS